MGWRRGVAIPNVRTIENPKERHRIKQPLPPTFFGVPPGCLPTPPPFHGSCPLGLGLERAIAAISARLFVTAAGPRTASLGTASQKRARCVKRHGRRRKKLKSRARAAAHPGEQATPRRAREPKSQTVPPSSPTEHNAAETDLRGASLGPTKSGNGVSRSPKPPRLAPVKDPQAVKSADFIKCEQN